jgi:MFS family permease
MLGKRRPACHSHAMDQPDSPLQIADYRRFWVARFTGVMATSGMVVVLGYQLYDVARAAYGMSVAQAAFQLGLMGLAQFLPFLLLTPVAGIVADRIDRRRIAAASMAIDLLIALALALATTAHALNLPLLFGMGAAHGMARVFMGPAMSSIAPNIVPPAILPKAIAANSMAMQAGSIAGPALAGLIFAVYAPLAYWTSVALLAVGVIALLSVRPVPPPRTNRNIHPLRQMAEGLHYVIAQRFLLGCVTLDLFAVLLGGATALLPVYARDILYVHGAPVGPHGLGLMRAAPALGSALMALALARWPLTYNVGAKMLWAVAVYGVATLAFGLSRNFALSLLLLVVLGVADMISVYVRSSLVQLSTPDDKRGRVSAISGLGISASNELGEMESGVAASLLGATGAVVMGGAGAIIITILWAVLFPEIRRARTFKPQTAQTETVT